MRAISLRTSAKKVRIIVIRATVKTEFIALKTLANSEYHFSKAQEGHIPDKVDLFTFMKVCDEVLGIKPR